MALRYGFPYWLERHADARSRGYPSHRGHLISDVAIVGGGFTGCLMAHVLANAGLRVIVLEQSRIGRGSACASTALLMQTPDRYLYELAALFGIRKARAIWRLSRRSVRDLIEILEPLACGLRPVSSLHLARDAKGAQALRRDHRARRAARLGGRFVGADRLRTITGARGTAAILLAGDAVADPYGATLALAASSARAGARLFEHAEVLDIKAERGQAIVRTARGTVACGHAIIATGFATQYFEPLHARFKMSTTYVIATEPIARRNRRSMGHPDTMFWDTDRPYHYFRWTDDGRILFGGEDRPVPSSRRARRAALVETAAVLRRSLSRFYPDLSPPAIDYAWEGLFAATPDGLPYIGSHPRYPRQLFALGYGGNGMTFASLAAQILLRSCLDRTREADAVFGFARDGQTRRT